MNIEFDDLIPSNKTNIEFDDLIPQGKRPGWMDAADQLMADTASGPAPKKTGSVLEGLPADPQAFNFRAASIARRMLDDQAERQNQYGTIGPIVGPKPTAGSVATGVLSDLIAGGKAARAGINQMAGDISGSAYLLGQAKKEAAQADLMRAVNTPEFESDTARGIYSGVSSTVRQLPALVAAIATRNPNIALGGMVAPMVPEEYGKFRQRGADPLPALAGAAGSAATEYITEKLPMGFLVKQFGRAGAGQFLAGILAREVPGEQVATLVQDAIDTAVANPDKTWGDYLAERPGAAYQTLLATLTQSGIMGGANAAAGRLSRQPQPAAPTLPDYQEAAARVFGRGPAPAPATPGPATPAPAPTPQPEVVSRILQAIEQTQNVQNVPPTIPAETQAPAVETPAPARSDAADPAGVPAAPAPDVEAAGLTFDDLLPAVTPETENAAPVESEAPITAETGKQPILQNRNRSTPSSIAQMQSIAANPDYGRLGFSRDFANGAPVVAGGQVAPEQLGRTDVAVASDGRRIPVQYAVVEASDVLASNQADGRPNADYGNQAVQRIRAIAGNGRIAGLQRAYQKGTTPGYLNELTSDTLHGVNPDVIRAMRAPVLVRVMPADQVTADIGDVSNTVGNLNLSAVEQANNDAQRVNLEALQFAEDGSITPEAVRQFVRAMPQAEQGGLIDTNGQPTKQAVDRINAAVFARAYGNDQLIRLFAQAQDPEARNVLSALAQVAPKMARLEGAGALDIRDVVTQAAEIAVNARREGKALSLAAQQLDMAADPMVGVVLDLFVRNARTVKPAVEALSNAADLAYTEATKAGEDMFGVVPRASRADVINQLRPQNERASQENLEQPAGREPVQVDAGRAEARPAAATDTAATEAGRPAEAERLTSYTPEEVTQRIERLEQSERERQQQEREAEQRAQADSERDTFALTGSDLPADVAAAQGQTDIFSAPAQPGPDAAKLEKDFRTYPTKILSVLIERGDLPKLHKAAGVKSANAFGDMPIDDQAAAYVKFVEQGGKPVDGLPADYNAWVASQERDIEVRRLQSDRVVRQANGKPFKTEAGAKQMQERFDLQGTHEIVAVDGGFELRQLSPSAQAEIKRKAEGRESYTEAQAAVADEMGIGQTPDGEWDATDEQFDEMERRTQTRMRGEERARINAAFDKLVSTMKTRHTDKGVALYEPEAPYNAEAPRRKYTDDRQLQLFLDNGPDQSQAGPRGEAAQRSAVSAVDDLRSTETILGLALSRDYAARQRVSLVGQKVESAEDLAILAQVYRDPCFETFRVLFVNDSGKVVSQVGLTSRLPASATAVMGNDMDAYLRDLSATARNRGATRFYMLHNHPSGIAQPSAADLQLTRAFAAKMPELTFESHVVIDTNEYSAIEGNGSFDTHQKDFGQPAPYRAQEWADVNITGPADVMAMAKRLQVDADAVTLIHTDNQYKVKAISTIPAAAAIEGDARKQVIRASLKVQGAQVFAVSRSGPALLKMEAMVRDAIHVKSDGTVESLASKGLFRGGEPISGNRKTRLSPDTSPEFNYLRRNSPPDTMQRAAEPEPEYGEKQPSRNRDALGRVKFRLGEVALAKLDAATRPLQERFGMRMASPELRRQLRQMKATIEEAKRQAVDVAKEMSAMPEADRAMVSDIVEKMIAPGVVPPEHAVRVADAITRTMDQQTNELVALGMLSPESAERWRGRYLPRIYNRQTELADDPLIKRLFKTGTPTMAGIGGGSLKGRGLFQDVSVDSVDQWLAMGYEVRDPHWKLNQGKLELKEPNAPQVAREQVTMWRDWTPSERAQMGENRDAMYRFVMGYTAMQRDIALGRLFNDIANNPDWVRRSGSEGWVQVPNTEIPDTGGVKRYGNLAGLWVRQDVMSHLTQFEEAANDTLQLYREALGLWKEGKTALNPVAHFNNVMSNVSMAHFAGVSYWDGHKYAAAVRDLVNDAPMVDEARKVGLFTGSFTKEEMVQAMPPELQKLANMEEGKARRAGKQVMNAMTFWLRKPLRDAYEFEDSFFKYLIYRDARQQGMSPEDATDYALRYIFTYDDLPSGARKVRDFAIPFFSWTYKAAPALLHTAMVYPWRFLAPAAVLNGINLVAYALAAGDEDDNWLEKIAKGRELEQEEREALPERTAGTGLLLNPKTVRLGTDSVTGNPVFLDVSRVVPGGDMFDMVNQAGGLPLPAPLMPNHPVLSAFSAMIANREMFMGRDVTDKNDTAGEAAEKRAKWMAGFLLPAVAPGGYHSQRIADAAANAMDTVIETPLGDFTGVDRSGQPVQPGYAAMQTFGIKARPMDLELEAQRKRTQEAALINSIAAEVRSMARLYQRGAASDRMMEQTREKAREKIERMRED